MKLCFFCAAPMKLVTAGRGFANYSCPRGCNYYLTEETEGDEKKCSSEKDETLTTV